MIEEVVYDGKHENETKSGIQMSVDVHIIGTVQFDQTPDTELMIRIQLNTRVITISYKA